MSNPIDEAISERRRKNFKVEIRPEKDGEPNEILLCITRNGSQWTEIPLTAIERLKVITALLED